MWSGNDKKSDFFIGNRAGLAVRTIAEHFYTFDWLIMSRLKGILMRLLYVLSLIYDCCMSYCFALSDRIKGKTTFIIDMYYVSSENLTITVIHKSINKEF